MLDLRAKQRCPGCLQTVWILVALGCISVAGFAQQSQPVAPVATQPGSANVPGATVPGVNVAGQVVTLVDAERLARANSPQFQAAVSAALVAHEDHALARAALLPAANFNNQYLYTQGNDTPSGRFIANNAVHEYISWLNVHEDTLSFSKLADYHRTSAAEAVARAQAEIAARGLNATVAQNYYTLLAANRKLANAAQAETDAREFVRVSQDQERGGEVAHSDVIKAQIQHEQRGRDLRDAQVLRDKAQLDLGVLLFPTFNSNFTVNDDLATSTPLPAWEQVQTLAARNNPDVRAASAGLREAAQERSAARAGYLPSLTMDYWYGIDSTHFATRLGRIPMLGYSAQATLLFPLWNWGATRSKIKQAGARQYLASVELSYAQRNLLASLRNSYGEARAAQEELQTLNSSLALAAQSATLTSLRYRAGEATVLEVVDAQTTHLQAANALADGQVRYHVALANLQALTGPF